VSEPIPTTTSLAALGQGGRHDRLDFRLVVRLLARCLELLRPVRLHLAGLFGGFAVLGLLGLVFGAVLVIAFWNSVLEGSALTGIEAKLLLLEPARYVTAGDLDAESRRVVLERIFAGTLTLLFGVLPAILALYYYQVWILQRVNQLLRVRLVERLQSLSLRFHSGSRVGDAIYRTIQDSAMVTKLIEVLILTPVFTLARYLTGVAVLAFFDAWLALVLLLVLPPLLLLGAVFSKRLRVGFREARETNSALTSRIQETLSAIRVIKAYGAEGYEQGRFEGDSLQALDAAYRARGRFAVFTVALFWVTATALVIGGGWAAYLASEGRPLGPSLAAWGYVAWSLGTFNMVKGRFGDGNGSIRLLFKTWGRTQDIAIGLDRVFELIDTEPEVEDAPDAVPFESVREGVRYEGVTFRYDDDRPVLEGADFEARVGTVNAIVGATGAGKTTLMALLLRLFDPGSGRITVDGRDLRGLTLASVRERVSVALQENVLFGATIRENIRYAVPDADDAAVREAARIAGADEFIERLPEGYDTPLGERGTKLSTGQRQRLSIARAVLKDPAILILDEPTASLDARTEERVLRNLAKWSEGRIVFLITHRLSTIRRADQILFVAGGRIAECGSHDELISRAGAYHALVAHESRPPAAAGAAS
jgi:subfamily B ATP-binding cassette protein MsbA